jgi:hypothetical protein
VDLRLRDGTTISVPITSLRGPVNSDICCFCGETVDYANSEYVRLAAVWTEDAAEKSQGWGAHHRCLADRMDERVRDVGPFFGDR